MPDIHGLVDASGLEIGSAHSGVARVIYNLYTHATAMRPSLRATFLHQRPLARALPPRIKTLNWYPIKWKRPWRAFFLPLAERYVRPDFVHFPRNGEIPLLWPSTKAITTLHDVLPLEIPGYFKTEQLLRQYHRGIQHDIDRTDLLFTDSHYSKTQIEKHFRVRHEPIVLFPACDLDGSEQQAPPNKPDPSDYFIYVGGYTGRKKVIELVAVFTELHRQNRLTSRLMLAGKFGYLSPRFQEQVTIGKDLGYIEVLGYIPDEQLARLITRAKGLLYPSKYEGFGLPVLEGMTLGCPVLTTPFTSIPEVGGDAVLYVDPDDPDDLAAGLVELENNADLRRELVQRGYAQAARFSWQRSAEQFLIALDDRLFDGTESRLSRLNEFP